MFARGDDNGTSEGDMREKDWLQGLFAPGSAQGFLTTLCSGLFWGGSWWMGTMWYLPGMEARHSNVLSPLTSLRSWLST